MQQQAITGAAVRLGAHAKYRSAGTVEFLVDDDTGKFYFLEVQLQWSLISAFSRLFCVVLTAQRLACWNRTLHAIVLPLDSLTGTAQLAPMT